jgi:signal peptidase I
MLKKIILTIINTISILIIICAVFVLLTVLFTGSGQAPSILGHSMFRVMTGSMEPTIPTDSLIVVKKIEASELNVGDVISFYSKDPSLDGAVNTHRIVAIEEEAGKYYFTTKGDANNVDDQYTTTESDLIGKVIMVSYKWGKAVRLLSNPLLFIPLIIFPLAVILAMNLYQTVSLARKIAREEHEQAIKDAVEEIKRRKKEEKIEE